VVAPLLPVAVLLALSCFAGASEDVPIVVGLRRRS